MFKIELNPYIIDVSYDNYSYCDEGCKDEGICRCGTIENLHVSHVNLDNLLNVYVGLESTTKSKKIKWENYKPAAIELYCIDRLQRFYKLYDLSKWEVDKCGGYYGEEVDHDSLSHLNLKDCIASIKEMLELQQDIEKIKYTLNREYSYLLPEIESCTTVHSEFKALTDLYGQNDYFSRLKRDADGYNFNASILERAIVIGNRIVDGYHRLANTKPDKTGLVKVFGLE